MSAISTNAASVVGGAGGTNRFNELSSEDFMKIIFTELQQQDPFEPNDSSALLEQLNSIRAIESDIDLTKNLESIVFQNQLATAGNLIGKTIEGLTSTNDRVVGNVFAVIRDGDSVTLQLDTGWEVPADNVQVIVDPQSLVPADDPTADDPAADDPADDADGSDQP